MLNVDLAVRINQEILRGKKKWGATDIHPTILLNAATEELGEVAHAINHEEGEAQVQQEIIETIGILVRLYEMVGKYEDREKG